VPLNFVVVVVNIAFSAVRKKSSVTLSFGRKLIQTKNAKINEYLVTICKIYTIQIMYSTIALY